MNFPIFLYVVALGAVLGRWKGTDYDMRPLSHIMFAMPFALACQDVPYAFYPVLALTLLAVLTGHGQYFIPAHPGYVKPEKVDVLVRPLFGDDPRAEVKVQSEIFYEEAIANYGTHKMYLRNVFGMCLLGLACTLPAGIALHSPVLALSGLLQGPIYLAAGNRTPYAEACVGAVFYACLLIAYFTH